MTFSIAAVCERTGQLGYAVTTSSVCVGARVGLLASDCVVFSQARTDPRLHQPGAEEFASSGSVEAALEAMKAAGTFLHWRQLGILSRTGEAAHHTGSSCLPVSGGLTGKNSLALGNFLAGDQVLPAMIDGVLTDTALPLADRLLNALRAGADAGGENDPLQSVAIRVLGADDLIDTDIRVDKSTSPLSELRDLLQDWAPKAAAYRVRALTPDEAPPSSQVEGGGKTPA